LKIGVVVPFYNGYDYLGKFLESVEKAAVGDHSYSVFIVDNSPDGKTIVLPSSGRWPVEVIRERPGIGYGKACNRGVALCREREYDYVLIANQDGYLSPGIFQHLLLPFQQDEDILIAAPLLMEYGKDTIEDFFVKYYLSQTPALYTDLMAGRAKPYYQLKAVSGAAFLFRLRSDRYRFDYLFDPLFHMYYEDEDLCRRVLRIHGKIVLVPQDALFYHQHSDTTDIGNKDRIKTDQRLSMKIYRIKDPAVSLPKALAGITADTFTDMLSSLLRGRFKGIWTECWSYLVFLWNVPRYVASKKKEMALYAQKTRE
jgi:GT2 family glycosyltransferase